LSTGVLLGLLNCSASADSRLVVDFSKLGPVSDQMLNMGEVRKLHLHQPNVLSDMSRNPYSRSKAISRFELWGNPDKFEGVMVASCGFTKISNGCDGASVITVYPSEESLGKYASDGLLIKLNPIFKDRERFPSGRFVEFVGVFRKYKPGVFASPFW
jgi:hypothetical protein